MCFSKKRLEDNKTSEDKEQDDILDSLCLGLGWPYDQTVAMDSETKTSKAPFMRIGLGNQQMKLKVDSGAAVSAIP